MFLCIIQVVAGALASLQMIRKYGINAFSISNNKKEEEQNIPPAEN